VGCNEGHPKRLEVRLMVAYYLNPITVVTLRRRPMDWKAFVASVVGSLAWPVVLAYFLFLFRDQLVGLPSRIEELTLPGGAGINLARQVDKVRDQAEIVEVEEGVPPTDVLALDPAILQLAQLFPEAAVVQAFKELEGVILQIRARLPDERPHRTLV